MGGLLGVPRPIQVTLPAAFATATAAATSPLPHDDDDNDDDLTSDADKSWHEEAENRKSPAKRS